jgi:phage baseplate assembly protein W
MKKKIIDKEIQSTIGCKLPLTSNQWGYFNPSVYTKEQAISNLKNLILTNKGERIANPHFGCDLYKFNFENINRFDIQEEIKEIINEQVKKWLPYIQIQSIQIKTDPITVDNNLFFINIIFSLKNEKITEELIFKIYQQ